MKNLLLILPLLIVGCSSTQGFISPSKEQTAAILKGKDDFQLCYVYFLNAWRGKEYEYLWYSAIIKEVDKRSLDCKSFPEYSSKKDFIREWVKEYEKQI
jgi:hypothetical protein